MPRGAPIVDSHPWRIWRTRDGLEAHCAPDENLTPYPLVLQIRIEAGTPTATHLAIDGVEQSLTAVGLRDIRLGLLITVATGLLFDHLDPEEQLDVLHPAPRQERRTRQPDALVRRAVEEYRKAVARGSRKPTEDAGKALGYSRSHVARLLVQARKDGLLGAAPSGRGGEIT